MVFFSYSDRAVMATLKKDRVTRLVDIITDLCCQMWPPSSACSNWLEMPVPVSPIWLVKSESGWSGDRKVTGISKKSSVAFKVTQILYTLGVKLKGIFLWFWWICFYICCSINYEALINAIFLKHWFSLLCWYLQLFTAPANEPVQSISCDVLLSLYVSVCPASPPPRRHELTNADYSAYNHRFHIDLNHI